MCTTSQEKDLLETIISIIISNTIFNTMFSISPLKRYIRDPRRIFTTQRWNSYPFRFLYPPRSHYPNPFHTS